mmetsp:Transcript_51492/g.135944  ORF Transcript_51492/g.135944 Transcript_51492/m.135944 type:complete len:390 (+) Transcript_51492:2-1171(+)
MVEPCQAIPHKNVLILGKTGAGKSYVGNLLLGRPAFLSSDDFGSVPQSCHLEMARDPQTGVELSVIDTCGFLDISLSSEQVRTTISQFAAPAGIHAIVVVVRAGRFGQPDIDALVAITTSFGADVWKHAVIIFNQCSKTREEIMELTQPASLAGYIRQWTAAGAAIFTVPSCTAEVDVEQHAAHEDVQAIKEHIAQRTTVYSYRQFEEERERLQARAQTALEAITTRGPKQRMRDANQQLLDGVVLEDVWEEEANRIKLEDEEARELEGRLRQTEAQAGEARQQRQQAESAARQAAQQAQEDRERCRHAEAEAREQQQRARNATDLARQAEQRMAEVEGEMAQARARHSAAVDGGGEEPDPQIRIPGPVWIGVAVVLVCLALRRWLDAR